MILLRIALVILCVLLCLNLFIWFIAYGSGHNIPAKTDLALGGSAAILLALIIILWIAIKAKKKKIVHLFPKLEPGEVALMRAEINTGIVLDIDYKRAGKASQVIYSVIDNEVVAIKIARSIISKNDQIEFCIYSGENQLLHYLNRYNIDTV